MFKRLVICLLCLMPITTLGSSEKVYVSHSGTPIGTATGLSTVKTSFGQSFRVSNKGNIPVTAIETKLNVLTKEAVGVNLVMKIYGAKCLSNVGECRYVADKTKLIATSTPTQIEDVMVVAHYRFDFSGATLNAGSVYAWVIDGVKVNDKYITVNYQVTDSYSQGNTIVSFDDMIRSGITYTFSRIYTNAYTEVYGTR